MRLANQVAIITGAGRGIGRAIALRFAQEGAAVAVDDIDAVAGQETVRRIETAGGHAIFFPADVSRQDHVRDLVAATTKAFGPPLVLVNSAICGLPAILANEWTPNVEVALRGAWHCIQAVWPGMRESGGGSIINISSVNALMGFGRAHLYSAVKAGLIAMSRSLCADAGRDKIRINCICPGTVLTEIWQERIDKDPSLAGRLASLYPIGRLGQPEDIANAALFLASAESSFVTGSVMVVDGGVTAANLGFGGATQKS
jgi:NAD(P)-dependent dehydrogenase (short-subunit alcohol dehydrogenase family)